MGSLISLDHIQAALHLPDFDPIPAQRTMAPLSRPPQRDPGRDGQPRYAATLLLLFPGESGLTFVLTRRPDTLSTHAGQISFPGGRKEDSEEFSTTALRETCEELGVCQPIDLLGHLSQLYIPPSDFYVWPYVGYIDSRPMWRYDPNEVAEVIECPVSLLLDPTTKGQKTSEFNGLSFQHGVYQIGRHTVWGATAIMLAEFEGRLRHVLAV
jgi:8-oxo-dGTP pyrophosphatase MutT (NUDIX family)